MMLDDQRDWIWRHVRTWKLHFPSRTRHFSFISMHYFWIIFMTILGSVLIYGTAGNEIAYIDALFFAGGANTQAGLNTVDVDRLTTFQQVVIYICALTSNPMTLHSAVVFLRLYWFEKRFQHLVREARHRRATISKSRSRSRVENARGEMGVNGRNITVMHNTGNKMTDDGEFVGSEGHNGSSGLDDRTQRLSVNDAREQERPGMGPGHQTQISFASKVKRSDGVPSDLTKLPPERSEAEHLAILERQRDEQDDEILRIPSPREAERGVKPQRLEKEHKNEGDADADGGPPNMHPRNTGLESRIPGQRTGSFHARTDQSTIVIAEPEHRVRDEIVEEVEAIGNTFSPLRFRKPRFLNKGSKKYHYDDYQPTRGGRTTFANIKTALSREKVDDMPYLSWQPTLGRNSQFPGLTLEQREELGGIEYRSLRTLALILVCYFWGWSIFGVVCLLPWIWAPSQEVWGEVVDAVSQSRTWWGFFTANSAFMDLGLTLTPDSMNSFNRATFVLLIMSFLIVIGNTGFPIMLRFIIWLLAQIIPRGSGLWEELRFLLDHPRRCFTLLFPSAATWWLFWILFIMNSIDLLLFCVLDLDNSVVDTQPGGYRVLDGFFQAISTRTAGFSVVNLAQLHPAVQTSYLIMMYISVFPIAISIRRTNVYEERSLGVYHTDEEEANENNALSYVGTHLRRQLSFDLWYVFLGLFILAISEGSRIQAGDFDMFTVLFEIVSAYGTVGMSLGYPTVNASLSSQFSVVGKLVIVAMMIRGRHRGLPYGLDRAILLPSESRFENEAVEAQPVHIHVAPATATTTGMRRASASAMRGRGRSRSADRNILMQFLHPGPVVPRDLSLPIVTGGRRRANSEPVADDEDENISPTQTWARPRVSQTSTKSAPHL